jgi:type II secretory pathway pseudopilin PulG
MLRFTYRPAFSLVELILFFGIFAIIATTLTTVYLATQDARIRQQYIAEVEQRGTQLMDAFGKIIRRAEVVMIPASGQSGSLLALQMAINTEYPTILSQTSSGNILLVQKTSTSSLVGPRLTVKNMSFVNIGGSNVVFAFDIQTTIPTIPPKLYSRHFEGTATLFPVDIGNAGGCGSCPIPSCNGGYYRWYHCLSDVCTLSAVTFPCH